MNTDPFDKPERKKFSQNFVDVVVRSISSSNQVGLIALLAWFFAISLQVLSIGAKILTRRKLGIRAAGRIRFILHIPFAILISYSNSSYNFSEEKLLSSSFVIYLAIYLLVISILWFKNLTNFNSRTGDESDAYFRGYGFFNSQADINAKNEIWIRLYDPWIIVILAFGLLFILGNNFKPVFKLICVSSAVLFMEESLYIYDEYNQEYDRKTALALVEKNSKSKDSINTDY